MARIHTNLNYEQVVDYKAARHGALEDAFWDEDELVDHRRKGGRKKAPKKKKGCPGNDMGPHVYVWVSDPVLYTWWPEHVDNFYKRNGFHRYEKKQCCGCPKTNGRRYTEQMQKLLAKRGWYYANYGD